MTRYDSLVALSRLALLLLVSGCAVGAGDNPEEAEQDVGGALSNPPLRGSALNGNALNGNALNGNALNGNALNGNGLGAASLAPSLLGATRLSPEALLPAARAALQDPGPAGDLSRELLKYTVSCAFEASRSFHLHWIDADGVSREETYAGLLGLAPGWANHPLYADGQRWVSACLISRVNRYHVPVQLSSRGAAAGLATSAEERAAFPRVEGAFWGNVFTANPTAYACSFPPNDAHSQSLYRACAFPYAGPTGELSTCGIVQPVGSCAAACVGGVQFYDSCSAAGSQASSWVVTVFLQ